MLKGKVLFLILTLLTLNLRYIKIYIPKEKEISVENNVISSNNYNFVNNMDNQIELIDYIGYIKIPKINLYKGLVNIDSAYNNVDKNIQIIKGSNMPDVINGNLILAAHSGNSNVSFFKDLDKLQINDSIYIEYNKKNYEYKMSDYYIVEKTGYIDIIRNENVNTLTLITCIENTNKQLVVISELHQIIN